MYYFYQFFCIKLNVRNERIKVTRMYENAYLSIESLKAGQKWLVSLTGEQLANGFVTFVTFGLRSLGPPLQNPGSAPEPFWSSLVSRFLSTFPMLCSAHVKQQNFQMEQDFLKMKD